MAKAKTSKTTTNKNETLGKKNYKPWYIAGAVILVMLSTLTLFVSSQIYDSEKFAENATAALTSEVAREAIAKEVTSELLSEQSLIAQKLLSEPLESIIASMLNSEAFSGVFSNLSGNLHGFIISKDFEPITIDIGSITSSLDSIVSTIKPDNELNLAQYEEEEIILLENAELPPFKTISNILMIMGPLLMLTVVVGAIVTFRRIQDKRDLLKYSGQVLMISGVLLLILTLTSGNLLTISITDPERSIILREIYNSFISNFRTLQILMVAFGAILYGVYYYLVNDIDFSIAKKNN